MRSTHSDSKVLVIGANSRLVNLLKLNKGYVNCISHLDIHRISFSNFKSIWLFSWSYKNRGDNLRLLSAIPLEKCVLVSTTAVMSLGIRPQWNNYPNWKLEAEQIVLAAGGYVVRLGVIYEEVIAKSAGTIPTTSVETLADLINGYDSLEGKLSTLVDIDCGGLRGGRAFMSILLYRLACSLPSKKLVQLPLEGITKFCLRSATYGYSADSARFFADKALVGYGVLGSAFCRNLRCKKAEFPTIIVSPNRTEVLTENGFRGTRIGRYMNGLAAYWHRGYIDSTSSGYIKKVPVWARRLPPPKTALKLHVSSLVILQDRLRLLLECETVAGLHLDCNSLILAAGPLENCRILQTVERIPSSFSDHEIGMIGTVSNFDKEVRKLLKFKLGLMWGRGVHLSNIPEQEFILDFRPHNQQKHKARAEDIYNDSTSGIIFKLIKRSSFWEINEALFNKFGIAFATDRLSAFIQVKVKNCITADENGLLMRRRMQKEQIRSLQAKIAQQYTSFQADENVFLFDGQHILGARSLLENSRQIRDLVSSGKLVILGSPTTKELGPEHHTVPMLRDI